MNGIQVKTYLFPKHTKVSLNSVKEVDEIRRFNLSLDVQQNSSLYKTLIEKIKQAYGSFLPNESEIKTYWQDDENELIGFTSDVELQYAVDVLTALNMSKPYKNSLLFKVYVARKSQPSSCHSSKPEQPPQVHLGVVCDACDGSIIGYRYKCSVCPDYDLCEECNSKNLHKEHEMTEISRPRPCPFQAFGNQAPGCHRGGGQRHHQRRQNRQCNRQNPFENIMKNFMNVPQFAANQVPLVNNPDQLKAFGENLKKVLDPFGIDVSYYVDSMTKDQNPASTKPETEKKTPESDQKATETSQEKEKEATATATTTMPNDTSSTEKVTIQRSDSIMDESNEDMTEPLLTKEQPMASQPESPEPIFVQASAPESEPSLIDLQKSISESAPFNQAINALQSVITSNYKGTDEASEPASSESMVDGFNLIDMQQATGDIEKELKIIRAIEQLKLMGYSDDGGWLTRLVSAKKGNINAVLDAITPKQ